VFWAVIYTRPNHFWGAIVEVLMWANVVIEKGEFFAGLMQLRAGFNRYLANERFECAEESFDATVLPRGVS
jgi:hypothetical protein